MKELKLITWLIFKGGSPGDVSEEPVTQEKQNNGWKVICDVDVPINISIKLGLVSVNGPRETYFVDGLRI